MIKDLEFVDVYPWLAVLEQFDENNFIRSSILFNLNDPSTFSNIALLPNSKLFFANVNTRIYAVDDISNSQINDYKLNINHSKGNFSLPVLEKFDVKTFVDLLGLDMSMLIQLQHI